MKLNLITEFAPPLQLSVSGQEIMQAVYEFLGVVDRFFKEGAHGWGTNPKVTAKYGGKTFRINVRCGTNIGTHQGDYLSDKLETIEQPRVVVDPSWDGSVEMRLDVPRNYRERVNWEQERLEVLKFVAAQASATLPDAVGRAASGIVARMRKSGKVANYP